MKNIPATYYRISAYIILQETPRKPNGLITRHLKKNENLVRAANLKTILENKWKGFLILWGVFDFGLKGGNYFVIFKSLSICLFQRRSQRDDIANFITLTRYLAL